MEYPKYQLVFPPYDGISDNYTSRILLGVELIKEITTKREGNILETYVRNSNGKNIRALREIIEGDKIDVELLPQGENVIAVPKQNSVIARSEMSALLRKYL